jgi:cytochrome c oxidase subunit 1
MALTDTAPTDADDTEVDSTPIERPAPVGLEAVLGTTGHVVLGRVLVGFSLLFLAADLLLGALVQLEVAGDGIFERALIERLVPNHLLGILLEGLLPLLLGLAFIVVPAQLGAPKIAFPRAAALAVWLWLLSAITFGVAVAADGSYGGTDFKLSRLGNIATGGMMLALMVASVCVVTTVFSLRPAGMRLERVPFFSFSMLVAGSIWLLTLPTGMALVVTGHITRATSSTLLVVTFQDGLSYLFLQPAAYIVVIPILGIALDAVAHLSGTQQRFRGVVLTLIGLAGLMSYGGWATTEIARNTGLWTTMAVLIALPLVGILGAIADTMMRGRPKVASPVAFSVLAVMLAALAAVAGIILAVNTSGQSTLFDLSDPAIANGQYYLIVGATILGAIGGLYYWARQAWGDSLPASSGNGLAPLATLGAMLFGLPLVIEGLTNPGNSTIQVLAGITLAGAVILALCVLLVLATGLMILSGSRRGDDLLADPWGDGATLEWSESIDSDLVVSSAYPLSSADYDGSED